MRSIQIILFLVFSGMSFGLESCEQSQAFKYKKLEEKELHSGVRRDSLFKGLSLGMERLAFRQYCYERNVVDHDFKNNGPNSSWVITKIPTGMKYSAAINFYPTFRNGVIAEVDAIFLYDYENGKKAPFTKESLLDDVIQLMSKWYGVSFFKIEGPDETYPEVYVCVQGNRRITVYPPVSAEVRVRFVDLTNQKK